MVCPVRTYKWNKSVYTWRSVPFKRFEWYEMVFDLRFVPLERFRWYKTIMRLTQKVSFLRL